MASCKIFVLNAYRIFNTKIKVLLLNNLQNQIITFIKFILEIYTFKVFLTIIRISFIWRKQASSILSPFGLPGENIRRPFTLHLLYMVKTDFVHPSSICSTWEKQTSYISSPFNLHGDNILLPSVVHLLYMAETAKLHFLSIQPTW